MFMEHAHNTNLRDMLDLVALDLKQNFTSEAGTKQSFNYDVRHFYKKLYFNPGLKVILGRMEKKLSNLKWESLAHFLFLLRYKKEVMDIMLGMEE